MSLDSTDLELVRLLQEDGRASHETLAERVGLSRSAARTRVVRLVEEEVVRIVGVVHPAVLGNTVSAHVAVAVDGPAEPVARYLADLPESVFVTLATGDRPVVAELRVADFGQLSAVVRKVTAHAGVRAVDTTPYTRVLKDPHLPSAAPQPVELDETDHALLREFQADGRMSYAELAGRVGMSPGATRTRALRMLDAGVFRVSALTRPGTLGVGYLAGFSLRRTRRPADERKLRRMLTDTRLQFAAECVGGCDLTGTVGGGTVGELLEVLEELRSVTGVRDLRSWLHLDLVKERYDAVPA